MPLSLTGPPLRHEKGERGFSQFQVSPLGLSPCHLCALRVQLNLALPEDALFFAVLTACFFGLLRIGNALTSTPASSSSVVLAGDLRFLPQGAVLKLRSSKTIQFRDRIHSVVLPHLPNHPLCPVTALRNLFSVAGTPPPTSPLFSCSSSSAPTAQAFRQRLSRLLAIIGQSPEDFSTHSLRRGGATWLLNAGALLHLIKILGDWRSDCVLKYLRPDPADSLNLLSNFTNNSL